jgi:hypothetical protein
LTRPSRVTNTELWALDGRLKAGHGDEGKSLAHLDPRQYQRRSTLDVIFRQIAALLSGAKFVNVKMAD